MKIPCTYHIQQQWIFATPRRSLQLHATKKVPLIEGVAKFFKVVTKQHKP